MIHGLGMHGGHWLRAVRTYQQEFRFYLPDLRGAGRSRGVRYNQLDIFQNNMEDVEDLVAHFALRDLSLVGYSMGASTSLHWLRAGGFAHVRRYLHIDQAACVPNRGGDVHGLFGRHQERIFRRSARLTPLLRALRPAAPLFTNLHAWHSSYLDAHDYREALAACPTPMTFFVGMRSALYPSEGQLAVAGSAPDGRVIRFEASGHLLPFTEPRRFARELGQFLREPR
jgi:pimeloyl-ACP methyl ester carboxylesterase